MPIDEGLNVDLRFLILEVKKQARASASVVDKPSPAKIKKINVREHFIDNLKDTLESKCYFNIHREEEGQINQFRAIITIAVNLERCADFFISIANQMSHVKEPEEFLEFNIKRYYQVIYKAIDAIYPALSENNLELAQTICDYEQVLDDYYNETAALIRAKLHQPGKVDDLLTLLAIAQYLERVGDSFLNIGEAILDIRLGEQLGILQFRNLQKGLASQNININDSNIQFKPIMNTRSGCRVARISLTTADSGEQALFYKEGAVDKIEDEVRGLALWQEKFPGLTPKIVWHEAKKNSATMLLEYIEGDDLLKILINGGSRLDQAMEMLTKQQMQVWKKSHKNKAVKSDYVTQLLSRRSDIQSVHPGLFEASHGLDLMIKEARKIERQLPAPFSTLIHGDFNADNIIFQFDQPQMYYVDVHRSGYGDYVQDVSVFLISNLRVPLFSSEVRQRLNMANQGMYECAASYAVRQKDKMFQARLALGLFRSLITSTRFVFDKKFSAELIDRAKLIVDDLKAHEGKLNRFKINPEYFLYR
ncbi:phosphotransferase [Pseudomonadales bacterium]|nr:phosphotransferase [Pseudomonadales bacterium]MDB9866307.1 phosphotransferase [Pseudomonadales bacterium]MDC1368339.1 phosphotransferase [Pseudomonadales bacterium]MDC1368354.1 phosphotransferase [Pseudomonadales bacterium]